MAFGFVKSSPQISVKIDGDEELIALLKKFSKGFQAKALVQVATQGAEIIRKEAVANAPRKTGKLKRSLAVETLKSRSNLATVGVSWRKGKKNAFWGLFVEKGTKRRQRHKWRKKPLTTGPVSTGSIGTTRAFLEPAYQSKRDQASREMKIQLSRLIRRAMKKGLGGG